MYDVHVPVNNESNVTHTCHCPCTYSAILPVKFLQSLPKSHGQNMPLNLIQGFLELDNTEWNVHVLGQVMRLSASIVPENVASKATPWPLSCPLPVPRPAKIERGGCDQWL